MRYGNQATTIDTTLHGNGLYGALSPSVERLIKRFYPDNFRSGTWAFYAWVKEACHDGTVMLNLGAGAAASEPIRSFRGTVKRVVGADPDPVVLTNEQLDERHVIPAAGHLPFADASFDIVLSDFVLEHIERPADLFVEIRRVLRPAGSFFFRTPNRYHYVSIIGRFTNQRIHRLLANRVRCMPADAHEPWPTFYRANSRRRIIRLARDAGFSGIEIRMWEAEPSYLVFHPVPFLLGVAYERLVNLRGAWLRANIFGHLVR